MFRNYLSNFVVFSLCLTTSCVNSNPSHKLPIKLEVNFFINSEDKLCFKPDFGTANIESRPYKLEEISNVFFGLDLITQDSLIPIWEDNLPKGEKYHGQSICSEKKINKLLNEGNEYAFCMRGFEPKGRFNVVSCPGFIYENDKKIQMDTGLSS